MKNMPEYPQEKYEMLKQQSEQFWNSLSSVNSMPVGLPSHSIANLTVRFLGMTHDFDIKDAYGIPNLYLFNKGKGILAYRTNLNPSEISLHFPEGLSVGEKLDMDFIIKGHQIYKGSSLTFVTCCAFYPASDRPQVFLNGGNLHALIDFHAVPALIAGQFKDVDLREQKVEQLLEKEILSNKPIINSEKRVVHAEQLKLF